MLRLLLAVMLLNTAQTSFTVAIAWEAVRRTGTTSGPAVVFAVWGAMSLFAGPLLGVLVDRLKPHLSFLLSQVLTASSLAAFATLHSVAHASSLLGLLAITAIVGAGATMANPALHGLLQTCSGPGKATVTAARNAFAIALGFVLGFSFGGQVLEYCGMTLTMLLAALVSLAAAALVRELRFDGPSTTAIPPTLTPVRDVLDGLIYIWKLPVLREAAVAYIACYLVFHTALVLLAPFAKLVLALNAAQFGALRASWSVGAAIGALGLAFMWGARAIAPQAKYAVIAVLGLCFVMFAQSRTYSAALILITIVGVLHALSRSLLDGLLLESVEAQVVGRVRSNINSLISAISTAVSISVAALEPMAIPTAFAGVGLSVAAWCIYMLMRPLAGRVTA